MTSVRQPGDSAEAAKRSAENAERAANTAERSAALVAEQHHDDQIRRFEVSFDPNTQKLMLRNTSTTAAWDRVVIGVVNASEGPITALGDAPPEPMGDPPFHVIDLGPVEPGDVRPITVERSSDHTQGLSVMRLTCWRNDNLWPVLMECEIPPPPPELWAATT
jgi:hypothetical protein